MSKDTAASKHLAENVRELRTARGLTQAQLAKMSQVPRATWANIESGSANPTLSVLTRVASTLQVSIEELISPPRAQCRLYKPKELRTRARGQAAIRMLLPDAIPGIEIERMEIGPRGHMRGIPHTAGTREYLTCESGQVHLTVSGETWKLSPGDVLVFRGDQKHNYHNPDHTVAIAYSVVLLAPSGS